MTRTSRQAASVRPFVEYLECRCVPATIIPTTFADGGLGSGSLRDAVLQFNADTGTDDDIIQLEAGTYALTLRNAGNRHETAGLTGDLNLTQTSHRWIIQGTGPSTVIDASQLQDRVFQIVNPGTHVIFQDLVIQGGLAQDNGSDGAPAGTTDALGGGIFNNGGDITLDNVVLRNNMARGADAAVLSAPGRNASGGGLYSTGGALTLTGAAITDNQALGGRGGDYDMLFDAGAGGDGTGGGLYAVGGSLDIADSVIASNRVIGGRGGDGVFCSEGSCSGRSGAGGLGLGGGLFVTGGSLTIASSTIASNQGVGGSPGEYLQGSGRVEGGALYNTGTLIVSNSMVSGNTASGSYSIELGVGISNYGTLMVSNSTLSSNTASGGSSATGSGGGIYNWGMLTVSNSILSSNTASGGGGIYNYGTLTVSNSTLSRNTAGDGGGISNYGTLTVNNSTLSGNTAGGGSSATGSGGGIYNWGMLTVSNSILSSNTASGGGGIYNYGTLTVSNSTLSGNTASGYFNSHGGGIYTLAPSTRPVTLTNVTLTGNQSPRRVGAGLYVSSGTTAPVLHNTLIADNFYGAIHDDVEGTVDSRSDHNLIGNGTGMTGLINGVNGNQVGTAANPIDPRLGPLADNGGPTLTHAVLPGSPALNASDPDALGSPDQRGVVRTGGVNIGAYQASATAFLFTAPDTVDPGVPFDVTVTAVDPFGQVAVGYTGTITFSTSDPDPGVVLPADYAFTLDDGGVHTFTDTGLGETTLVTPGDQTLTVVDTADNTITGSAVITVGGTAPGTGSHGLGQSPQPGAVPGSAAQASEPSSRQAVAVDRWFVSLNKRDAGFILAQPIRHPHAQADWWALDFWWAGEPLFP